MSVDKSKRPLNKVFSVWDEKSEGYLPPFYCSTKGVAYRQVMDAVANKDHPFVRYAEDYKLYFLGEFDEVSGTFFHTGSGKPEFLAHMTDFVKPSNPLVDND